MFNRLSRIGLKGNINGLTRISRRTAMYEGRESGSYYFHGRPPIWYAYLWHMSLMGRGILIFSFLTLSQVIEHLYYPHPPQEWYDLKTKFKRRENFKTSGWGYNLHEKGKWRSDCPLGDLWCWKGVDPRDYFGHH